MLPFSRVFSKLNMHKFNLYSIWNLCIYLSIPHILLAKYPRYDVNRLLLWIFNQL